MNPRRDTRRQRHSLPFIGAPTGAKPLGHVRARLLRAGSRSRIEFRARLRYVAERCLSRARHADVEPALIAALETALNGGAQ